MPARALLYTARSHPSEAEASRLASLGEAGYHASYRNGAAHRAGQVEPCDLVVTDCPAVVRDYEAAGVSTEPVRRDAIKPAPDNEARPPASVYHIGGGWYEVPAPDGETVKVQGKEAAEEVIARG